MITTLPSFMCAVAQSRRGTHWGGGICIFVEAAEEIICETTAETYFQNRDIMDEGFECATVSVCRQKQSKIETPRV